MMLELEECPICDTGKIVPQSSHVHRFVYLKKKHEVTGLEHGVCDHCGAPLFLPSQMARNKAKIEAYQRSIVGLMGPQDILALREKYMISQLQAAAIFQCGQTQFSKWERGEHAPTGPTAILLRKALENQELMRELAADARETIELPQSRKPMTESVPFDQIPTAGISYLEDRKRLLSTQRKATLIADAAPITKVSYG